MCTSGMKHPSQAAMECKMRTRLGFRAMSCGMMSLSMIFGISACTPSERKVMVCDPECSLRPISQVQQELREIFEDDGRLDDLEAVAAQDPRAAHDLALRYFRGDGAPRNNNQAVSWMRVAAEQGDLKAQKALGHLYMTGLEGIGRDPGEAHAWLLLAASRGDIESQQLLAEAEAAKRSNAEEFQWMNRWRPVIAGWWRSGYSYYGTWDGRAWSFRPPANNEE